jgi:hypothetical protein
MENGQLEKKIFKVVIPVVALAAILVAGYLYNQNRVLKQSPQVLAQKEVADLVAKVSKLIMLPAGETPTVATVSDPEALKDQAFFTSAQKGDKVLIFTTAKKAVLYSVTLNRVIDIAPLNIGNAKGVTPPKSTTTP